MTNASPQTRGFLFSDLRGYSAFADRFGDSAARDLLRLYRSSVREVIATFGGAEIRTEGDSFYVVFDSVSSAVRAGLAILTAVGSVDDKRWGQGIPVGIGVHAGEAEDSEEGIVSNAVNVAARICALAEPGELLVSDTVRALTRTYLDARFTPRGRRRLKGIADPVSLYRVDERGALPTGRHAGYGGIRGRLTGRWVSIVAALGAVLIVALVGAALVREGAGGLLPSETGSVTTSISEPATGTPDPAVTTIVVPSFDPEEGLFHIPLEPGTHQFEKLEPRFRFDVPEGDWYAYRDYLDAAGVYLLKPDIEGPPGDDDYLGGMDFGRVQVVFTSPCLDSDTRLLGSTPNALTEWLQENEALEASHAVPVNLAGHSGLQVDVTLAEEGEVDPCPDDDLPSQAAFLFPVGEDAYHMLAGERLRVITLDMAGLPFSILLWSTAATFDEFIVRVTPVLDSLRVVD